MTDNFELIKSLMKFENPGDFYFCQIIQRKKENPGLSKSQKLIKNYFFYKKEDLDKKKEEIIKFCEMFNARAYIAINRRNDEKIALETLKIITDNIITKKFSDCKLAYISACGQFSADPEKKWVIDYDEKDTSKMQEIIDFISTFEPKGDKYIATIPTKNGYHIITRPFNKMEYAKKYKGDDIKKDNFTILYCI